VGEEPRDPVLALPVTFQRMRTPDVVEAEQTMLKSLEREGVTDQSVRLWALSTIAAAIFVDWTFERVDGAIWGSQLQLLEALGHSSAPFPRDLVKTNYFEKAAAAFPTWFDGYSFDAYIGFLSSNGLIDDRDGTLSLTLLGRDYLIWRLRQRKARRFYG